MRKTPYCETIDAVRAPARAVERATAAALGAAQSGKVISMKQQKRHTFFKPAVIAAGLAVAVAVGGVAAWLGIGQTAENTFVMTVGAAELKADTPVTVESGGVFSLGGQKDAALINDSSGIRYSVELPLHCTGEDIESVTYSVDSGTLGLYCTNPEQLTVTEEQARAWYVFSDDNRSVTFQYDRQLEAPLSLQISGSADALSEADRRYLADRYDALFNVYGNSALLDEQKAAMDVLLGDGAVHCTVRFTNGAQQTQDVRIGTKIQTYAEYDHSLGLQPRTGEQGAQKGIFITYTMV